VCSQSEQRIVLLVEDEAMIGMALADALEEAGFVVAGPVSTTADALGWLARMRPDLALVDIVLRDGPCMALVRELRKRGIPFVINSGHPRAKWRNEPDLADAQWLEKPTGYAEMIAALKLAQSGSRNCLVEEKNAA
jgi:DNA-binding response OmpR family regulator